MSSFISEWANSAAKIETQKRRLEILRYLSVTPGYEAAAQLLRFHCGRIGVPSTSDQIEAAIEWLREQELITVRGADHPIARLTKAGQETSEGGRAVPGVLRPDP